jgi:hypothetical protein
VSEMRIQPFVQHSSFLTIVYRSLIWSKIEKNVGKISFEIIKYRCHTWLPLLNRCNIYILTLSAATVFTATYTV